MKIGFTASTFDFLHAGHILMLEEAARQCDHLIVGLQTDPTVDRPEKNKPVQSLVERYIQLSAVRYVNQIIPYTTEKELIEILMSFPINVRIIGEEYKNKMFTGRNVCELRGIEIHYNSRSHEFSSTELRNRTYQLEKDKLLSANVVPSTITTASNGPGYLGLIMASQR